MLLKPKEIEISGKKFIIHKFPAVAGQKIVLLYKNFKFPNVSVIDYPGYEIVMFELMSYVCVSVAGSNPLPLTTKELINNHFPDWESLFKVQDEVLGYNCSFLPKGQD